MDQAFSGCVSLKKFKIPANATYDVNGAFDCFTNCNSLVDVDFTNATFTKTSDSTVNGFLSYTKVTSLKLNDSLTTIGGVGSFRYNKYLSTIELGANITDIGERTFAGCNNLKYIYCYAATEPALVNAFGDPNYPDTYIANSGELHIPNGSSYPNWLAALPNGGANWRVIDDL